MPPADRVIPTVPDFVAADRPSSTKMIYPDYKDLCLVTPPEADERRIEEDWTDKCWHSDQNQHCYYLTHEHRNQAQLRDDRGWRDMTKANEYYYKLKAAQKKYQKIDLSTSLSFFRRMTPQNDVFKQYRCEAIVHVFKGMPQHQIIDSIVFEGQQHIPAGTGNPPGNPPGAYVGTHQLRTHAGQHHQSDRDHRERTITASRISRQTPGDGHLPIAAHHLDESQTGSGI
eukprot:4025817-Amphidinium_carterae.1